MGLMDRVKAQATELAQQGKAKYDQVQATRRADAMLRNLGALVYQERTGRGAPDSQAQIDKLVADLSAHEAANGINLSPEPTDPPGSPGATSPHRSAAVCATSLRVRRSGGLHRPPSSVCLSPMRR